MNKEDIALAAERILNEPVLIDIIADLRVEALEGLARVAPENAGEIRKFQAQIIALDGLIGSLRNAILAGRASKRLAVA